MKTVVLSIVGFGSILGAQVISDDMISRVVEILGLVLLLLNTYLEWRRRRTS